jgi:superfamily II DNA or RNA helicase
LEQYVGRLHRLHEGKREVRVYDYIDGNIPMLSRMYSKRLRGYRAMGYSIQNEEEQLTLLPAGAADRLRSGAIFGNTVRTRFMIVEKTSPPNRSHSDEPGFSDGAEGLDTGLEGKGT